MPLSEVINKTASRETPGRPTHESFLACRYFSTLDLFRFLAILAVIWHHTMDGVWWFPASSRGFLGVDFFFVISGYLIVTLLLRERVKTGSLSLRRFYFRRSLRIFPIYYGVLGVMAVFFLVKPGSNMARSFFETLPYHALYLSNFIDGAGTILFITWTLSTEEQFYLFWPPVERWFRGLAIPILLGVIVVNQLVNFGWLNGVLGDFRKLSIAQITFTPICLGVLLAHALNDARWFGRVAWCLGNWWASLVLSAVLVLVCNVPTPDVSGWPRLLIQVVITLLLASSVIREDNGINKLLGFRLIRRVGVISYGMYLYHPFAIHAARVALDRVHVAAPPILFLLTFLLTTAVAEMSYRFYEMPFLRLKDRLHRT